MPCGGETQKRTTLVVLVLGLLDREKAMSDFGFGIARASRALACAEVAPRRWK
jgi:hypothetical protein